MRHSSSTTDFLMKNKLLAAKQLWVKASVCFKLIRLFSHEVLTQTKYVDMYRTMVDAVKAINYEM